MKKVLRIAIAVLVVLLVVGVSYLGYKWNNTDSSYTLTHEMRKTIEENWQEEKYGELMWGKNSTRFYGSHGDSLVLFSRQGFLGWGSVEFQVGGVTFYLKGPFRILVFRDGEWLSIQDAYSQGWLTWWQIRAIAEHHQDTWGDSANPLASPLTNTI